MSAEPEPLQLALEAPRVAELSGRVIDAEGVPVPDAWVRASNPRAIADAPLPPVLTDQEGTFVIRGRLLGHYALSIESASGRAQLGAVEPGSQSGITLPTR